MLRVKILKETIKKVDGKYVVYPKKGGKRLGTHDTEEEAKKQLAAIEISKAKNEEQIEEISVASGGAVQGFVDSGDFNEKEKDKSKQKGEKLIEEFSGAALKRTMIIKFKGKKQHKGHVERSRHQGLKNVMETDDTKPLRGETGNSRQSTAAALIKFANIGHIRNKRNSLWLEFLDKYGIDTLANAILEDTTSSSRIEFIKKELGASRDLASGVQNRSLDAIRDYYDFLMNEYMFWSYYNPHASPVRYADSAIKVPTAVKNLIRGHISRYISNPSRNNPASLSKRAIGKDSSSQKIYKDRPTLDNPLYDLPE